MTTVSSISCSTVTTLVVGFAFFVGILAVGFTFCGDLYVYRRADFTSVVSVSVTVGLAHSQNGQAELQVFLSLGFLFLISSFRSFFRACVVPSIGITIHLCSPSVQSVGC